MRRTGWVTAVVGAALALAACTGEGGRSVASAVGGSSTQSTNAEPDAAAKELAFVACMRQQGIADMPDPVPGDTSGRSAVKYALDVMGKGSDDAFQAALDKCQSLLPAPPPPEPPSTDEAEALRQFAQCMREHGIPDFPDSDPDKPSYIFVSGVRTPPAPTNRLTDGRLVLYRDHPVVAAAWDACKQTLSALPDDDRPTGRHQSPTVR